MKKLVVVLLMLAGITVSANRLRAQSTEATPRDGFYNKTSYQEREPIPYDDIREADVFWQKRIWRVIDSREKMNLPFKYEGIDWKEVTPLISLVLDAAKSGEITVYNEDNFKTVKPWAEVAKIGAAVDTVPLNDLNGNFIKDTVITQIFDPSKVMKWRLKEDWFFDKETSTMQVRIIAIAPLYYDEEIKSDIPMFWAYYPGLRNMFAKTEVFNPKNDAQRLTWDDIFEMRYFSSYIIKESNVFDRRIQDYAQGADALRESDRVKNDIFNFEHDLWSF